MKTISKQRILWMTQTAIFAAIVLVVQLAGGAVKVGPISFSLVLIPIVVGGMIMGPLSGAILGFVFGLVTLINGLTGLDPFTNVLLMSGLEGAIVTPLICLVKATAAGFLSALIYKLFKQHAEANGAPHTNIAGVFCAAATAPIVNTGLFILGALSLSDVLSANFVAEGSSVLYFLIIGCAGVNFLIELAVNLVFSPAIYQLIRAVSKGKLK